MNIVDNTTYRNGGAVHYQELLPSHSLEVTIVNNIIVPRATHLNGNTHPAGQDRDHGAYEQ